jgi:hypothetical protein
MRAVRVRRRQDEDVEVVDEPLRHRVDRVVAEQLLGGLEAGERRRPLPGVLLAVEEHTHLVALLLVRRLLADPKDRVLEGPALHVGVRRGRQEVGQPGPDPRLDDAGSRVTAIGARNDDLACGAVPVDRVDHLPGGTRGRSRGVRREIDHDVVTAHADAQRRVRHTRIAELGGDVVPALVAPGARSEYHRRALEAVLHLVAGRRRPGHGGLCPALVAVRLVRQSHQPRDVRELVRERLDARVDLGRVHVVGREVA